jgi:hypothetical protein
MPTREEYDAWILKWADENSYVPKHAPLSEKLHNRCREASEEMVEEFGNLRIEKGYVIGVSLGGPGYLIPYPRAIEHWWCVDKTTGEIVDPTVSQFDGHVVIERYEAYDEDLHGPLPTGKCMNCGELLYGDEGSSNICPSKRKGHMSSCERAIRAELGF